MTLSWIFLATSVVNISFDIANFFITNIHTKWWLAKKTKVSISIIIINLPIFLFTFIKIQQGIKDLIFTIKSKLFNWIIYFSITVSIITIAADFSCLIYWYLEGEVTTLTIVKALIVGTIALFSLGYCIVLVKNIIASKRNIFITLLALITIIPTFISFNSLPKRSEILKMREDTKKIYDLSVLYNLVSKHYISSKSLPINLTSLLSNDMAYSNEKDILTNQEFEYYLLDKTSFKLCANFTFTIQEIEENTYQRRANDIFSMHREGKNCFIFKLQHLNEKKSFEPVIEEFLQ